MSSPPRCKGSELNRSVVIRELVGVVKLDAGPRGEVAAVDRYLDRSPVGAGETEERPGSPVRCKTVLCPDTSGIEGLVPSALVAGQSEDAGMQRFPR